MDSLNITHTVFSITAPGTQLFPNDDVLAQKVTREANEYMSSLCVQHPSRFSFFASLPLPSIPATLEEIDSTKATPGFKGFALMTNARIHI
jgi:predicted TIM-barrel fold metal-dependent hydrolase